MRKALVLLTFLLSATPAAAQDASAIQLPRELTDPAAQMKLARTMQAVSSAIMNIRVGDLGAALEGREATARERNTTVGDVVRRNDPNFERDVARQVATVGPAVQRSAQAINRALPEVMRDVAQAQRSVERAVANLPDPTYPVR